MLEVTVQLFAAIVTDTKILKSAKAVRRLRMPTVPRKGETLVIGYIYNDEDGKEVGAHITPTVRDVSYVFPWENTTGNQTGILLDCGPATLLDCGPATHYTAVEESVVIFEKGVEIWRAAKFDVTIFDVTIKEEEDDF